MKSTEISNAVIYDPNSCNDRKLATKSGVVYPKLSEYSTPPVFEIIGDSDLFYDVRVRHKKIERGRKPREVLKIPKSTKFSAGHTLIQIVIQI